MIIKAKSYFATAFFTRMVFPGFSLSLSFPCFYSFLSCSAFFSLSCSALSRTSTDTRHNLTICTQKATRFNKGPRRSRCCGQASYSLSCSALFFFLSCSALSRTSTDTGHNLTICTQKASRFNKGSRRSQLALKGIPLSSRQQLARQRKKKRGAFSQKPPRFQG